MTLRVRAKVLLNVWSYDFYDMTLSTDSNMMLMFPDSAYWKRRRVKICDKSHKSHVNMCFCRHPLQNNP